MELPPPEIPLAQALDVVGGDQRPQAEVVAADDGASDRERFESTAPLGEHQVVAPEDRLGLGRLTFRAASDHVELDVALAAGLRDRIDGP